MGPSSSGGVAVAQVLGIVEPFHLGPAPLGARAAHLIAEAERLALADRARYLADSDFVAVPVAGLLDPTYLAERRALINPDRAAASVAAGSPPNVKQGAFGNDRTRERGGTSQISIVDDQGNAFSFTTSIEYAFGARSMVRGFLLNNQLTDFSFEPTDEEGRPVANRVEPGKRPRSAMDPTMVFGDGGGLRYVLGSPGGPLIIPFNVKTIIALIDWRPRSRTSGRAGQFRRNRECASARAWRVMGSSRRLARRHGPCGSSRADDQRRARHRRDP